MSTLSYSTVETYIHNINPYGIIPFLTSVIILIIALNLLVRGYRSLLIRTISFFCMSLFIWKFTAALLLIFPISNLTLFLKYLFFVGWLFIPYLFINFVYIFCSKRTTHTFPFFVGSVVLLSIIFFSDVAFIHNNHFGHYPKLKFPFNVLVDTFYFVTCGLGLILLFLEYLKASESIRRNQAYLLFLGTSAGFLVSIAEIIYLTAPVQSIVVQTGKLTPYIVNYLIHSLMVVCFIFYLLVLKYGIRRQDSWSGQLQSIPFILVVFTIFCVFYSYLIGLACFSLFPISSVGLIVAIIFISYAVFKYRFMNISEIVMKFLVNVLLTTMFLGFYILVITAVTPQKIDIIPSIIFVILLIVIFNPLYLRTQRFVKRLLFHQKYNYQQTIKDVSQQVVTVMEHRKLIEIIRETIIKTMRVNTFVLFIYNDQSEVYTPISLYGVTEPEKVQFTVSDALITAVGSKSNRVFKEEIRERLADNIGEPSLELFDELQAILIIPMFLKGFLRGMLWLGDKETGDVYTTTDIDLIQILCNQTIIALDNARLYELAITDDLTRLYISRFMHQKLNEEIMSTMRYERPVSLLMLDLDHFKTVNDTYGHQAGDRVLKKTAAIIQEQVRITDLVARYGGEEMAVILPETDNDMAVQVAERIREKIGAQRFVADLEQTVSIGVATLEGETVMASISPDTPFLSHVVKTSLVNKFKEIIIGQADAALYKAKEKGRNRCENASNIPLILLKPIVAELMNKKLPDDE
ncbi:diguanylate cyclase [candidate division CSSED10-310 bacterium]|uniref:Diguanylate cyclase n=1 Tax=candidate division CSSED10-310 bacterium TaxID=2855610 RepID=A0ABV6Z0B8_UNCC1